MKPVTKPGLEKRDDHKHHEIEIGKEVQVRCIEVVASWVHLFSSCCCQIYEASCNLSLEIFLSLGESVVKVRILADMHERKAEMAREADAFIALPGGYGTMEELLEMVTWSQLGIHKKPVGLLNVDGHYNSLLALFDNGVEEGEIGEMPKRLAIVVGGVAVFGLGIACLLFLTVIVEESKSFPFFKGQRVLEWCLVQWEIDTELTQWPCLVQQLKAQLFNGLTVGPIRRTVLPGEWGVN
ncbi:hypothetical protein Vadar_017773 [Vaccinium darrowii]|uniref:Uncharacterized protein n=1 Tax=Vaccinium darrowii TaxID=229202 RepID=A0ACB7XI76_9ERIC|nr:hypothetical protein Vadar_017773 [Vaccinium darrowii]